MGGHGQCRRQLDLVRARPLRLADPHRAVDETDRNRAFGAREDLAGRAGETVGGLEVVDAPVAVEQGQQRAGRAVGGAGDGERLLDGAMRGIDAALRFAAGRPQATAADIGGRRRLRLARREPRQRFEHARQRRVGDLAAVEARLGRLAHREFAPRPHRAGVHLAARLDQRHAPVRLAFEDRPIERRRPLVAAHAGVDDERAHGAPDVFRDRALEERREDEVGTETARPPRASPRR